MDFKKKLNAVIKKNNSLLCIGLDTDLENIPKSLLSENDPLFLFNKQIIDSTADLVCSYKTNIAYYEAKGVDGAFILKKTVNYLKQKYPDIPVICDAKRGDIYSTSEKYAQSIFDYYKFDAVTVNPYLGYDGLKPFLKRREKGIIILCRTSNQGAADFQDLIIDNDPLYIKVAKKIIEWDQRYRNCLMVVGATWPEQLKKVREIAPDMFFLVPGIGVQGGDVENTLKNGLRIDKSGLIITISRAIIYASKQKDFTQKARDKAKELRDVINKYR